MRVAEPRDLAARLEAAPTLAPGSGDRFEGYGVLGVHFASGHWLALRRFPASSIGEPYASVWHRDPRGRWTFHADVEPDAACPRFFGAAVHRAVVGEIGLEWTGGRSLTVTVPGEGLAWSIHLAATPATRLLNGAAALLPERAWGSARALRALGGAAGGLLGLGRLELTGLTPNGQRFLVQPRLVWLVEASVARLRGEHLGPPVVADAQPALGDFLLPRWGVFAVGRACFSPAAIG